MAQGRIFAAALAAETNVFSPIPTDLESFKSHLFLPGQSSDSDDGDNWPAPLQAFRTWCIENDFELVQGLFAAAVPAAPVGQQDYEALRDRILDDLRGALPVAGVALSLHGAMMSAQCDDCEGDILQCVRDVVGGEVPVGAVLDPHAHLTDRMLRNGDILIFFKEYPHTDVFESAHALASILGRCIAGEVTPAASVHDCGMIGFYFTDREPVRSLVAALRDSERREDVLSVSLVHGFPWGDTPAMGTRLLVYTNGAPELGDKLARHFGERLFKLRGQTMPPLLSVQEAVAMARKARWGPLILADVSDNPGGGAPGDSTFLIEALLNEACGTLAVGPLWDPGAVRQAQGLGVGGEALMRVGGKASPFSGRPLDLRFRVAAICEKAVQRVDGWPWPMGDAVLLTSGNLELVVTSQRSQCLHPDVFRCVGVEPAERTTVVVKSAQHFAATFASIAEEVAYVETPAVLTFSSDPGRYRHLSRPKWPFDDPEDPDGGAHTTMQSAA